MQIMNGQTATELFVPLPAGGEAVYNAGGMFYYHPDHLGSFRFASSYSNRTMYFDLAHAPFGETYANSGTTDPAFTGQRQDTVSGLYDFPAREYSIQGRWPSPDPAGLAAVDPSNPQTWNRYAYALNNPLAIIDPTGMSDCPDLKAQCGDVFGDPGGAPGVDIFGGGDPIGCGWADFWGGDCATENRMSYGSLTRNSTILLPGNWCYESAGPYTCFNTNDGEYFYYLGRGGATGVGSGRMYLQSTSDCAGGGGREIYYALVQAQNGAFTQAQDFYVQEHMQFLVGSLSSYGGAEGPNNLGNSGYNDSIQAAGTTVTHQTFTAYLPGGSQINVFARDVYGQAYGTNTIYVQGAHGAQPAQIFVNNNPTPQGCVTHSIRPNG
jgi:RHS repeat-associated protein